MVCALCSIGMLLRSQLNVILNIMLNDQISHCAIYCHESLSAILSFRQPVYEYAPHSQACNDFVNRSVWFVRGDS